MPSLLLAHELYRRPVECVLRPVVTTFQKKCCVLAAWVGPSRLCAGTLRRCPAPAEGADELHAGAQLAGVEIERCQLGLQRDGLRGDHVEIAGGALTVLGPRQLQRTLGG